MIVIQVSRIRSSRVKYKGCLMLKKNFVGPQAESTLERRVSSVAGVEKISGDRITKFSGLKIRKGVNEGEVLI